MAGRPTGSIDLSARYFRAESEDEVRALARAGPPLTYRGGEGDDVAWEVVDVMSVDGCFELAPGDEVSGFATTVDELRKHL